LTCVFANPVLVSLVRTQRDKQFFWPTQVLS